MFNLQGSEIIVILILALVVLGPEKLPDAVKKFTGTYNDLKKMGNGFQSELKSVIDEPMREVRNTADMIRDAADPAKTPAEAPDVPAQTPERPATPVVAPPAPFASSKSLGTALPQPGGLPELGLAPPDLNGKKVNGHRETPDRAAAPSLPPPPQPPQ